jgi:hypothetical protein
MHPIIMMAAIAINLDCTLIGIIGSHAISLDCTLIGVDGGFDGGFNVGFNDGFDGGSFDQFHLAVLGYQSQ